MSNDLEILQNKNVWECDLSLKEIRDIYASKATENEFKAFVGLGKATGLNPFLREIWCVKYGDSSPASIFIGRDGYRRSAQSNPNYDYHYAEAVYSNDDFHYNFKLGEVTHKQNLKDRGQLIGAYCIVAKKNSSKPIYVFVEFKEYNSGKSNWASKPATMIKKVAEAQALRMAFQELFAGSYAPEELDREREIDITAEANAEKSQDQQKQFEGKPLSQTFLMDEEVFQTCINAINSAEDMESLRTVRLNALEEAKGDMKATNSISLAAIARKKALTEPKKIQQTNQEWLGEYEKVDSA
jgi:phage recombination protein Bet